VRERIDGRTRLITTDERLGRATGIAEVVST